MGTNQELKPKRGWLRRTFIDGPLWWFRGWKDIGKGAIALDEQKRLFSYTRHTTDRIRSGLKDLHANRDPNAPDAPNMQSFDEVLWHWGIRKEELPQVIRGIKLQIAAYTCVGLLSGFGFYFGIKNLAWWPIVNGGMVFLMAMIVIVCRYWRLQVLQSEQFFPFKSWISGKVN